MCACVKDGGLFITDLSQSLVISSLKLNSQQQVMSPDNLQECRNPHTNPPPRTSCQTRPILDLGWAADEERLQGRAQTLPASSRTSGRFSNSEKNAEKIESSEELQIKVSGQSGLLGISIAGGRGSLPYRDHDEGIFISKVAKGGPSEKAGVHVGDRLLAVNGLSVQGATHHEAVSALRNAGSCIRMKVLREKLPPRAVFDPDVPQEPPDSTGRRLRGPDGEGPGSKRSQMDSSEGCLSKRMEAAVCNGNSIVDLERNRNRTVSEGNSETLKKDSLQGTKHIAIPRIILTHPSTSDEDMEILTQILPRRELLRDTHSPDKRAVSECCDSAFYPP